MHACCQSPGFSSLDLSDANVLKHSLLGVVAMSTSLLLFAPIMVSVAFADFSITRYCTSLQGTQDSQGCTTTGSPSCYAQPSGNLGGVTLSFDAATNTASLHCCGSWYYTMTLNGDLGGPPGMAVTAFLVFAISGSCHSASRILALGEAWLRSS